YAREGCTVVWEESSIDSNPLLRDPEHADYRLQPGSPCIDTGTNDPPGGLPPYDVNGVPRPLDGDGDLEPWSGQFETADMGAYEYEYGPPTTPMICRVPTAFDFVGWEGEADPAPQTLSIWNCGIGTLDWEIAEDCPWLEVDPSDGESGGEIDEIIISVAIGGLPRGDYACTFDITDAAAANSPQPVHVNLRVLATLHVPGDYPTIQAAIDASVDGEVVLVADGTYVGEGNKNLDFGGKAITVRSENGPENCIIDCENDEDGFRFHSGETSDAIVDGFTIRNGDTGITCSNSSPMILNCRITGCTGAGVGCGDGSPTIINCGISGNAYGGIRAWDDVTIAGCTISGNTAGWGGGIMCGQGSTWISDCVITGNTASNFGAGVGSEGGDVTITNCTISGNTCTASSVGGAGIVCLYGSVVITNCTISGNSSISHGGGLYWYRNNPIISNCTITHNSAGEEGGGVACGFASAATLANCIVWDNSAELGPQIAVLGGDSAELSVCYNNVAGGEEAAYVPDGTLVWGPGNIDADPLFVDPNDADYHLSTGSPCIDAGSNCAVSSDLADLDGDGDVDEFVPFDLDGEGRFFDDPDTPDTGSGLPPIVDMGAYEFGGSDLPPCRGDLDGDRDVDLADLAELLGHYGMTSGANGTDGDMDCDGDVELSDLAELLGVYGDACG
ncbi:MAG: hypothetical protein KKI02_10040, partial [Planctomycetes bacterium]|nr:hypothetical protein [Planctomycetota bacterium]